MRSTTNRIHIVKFTELQLYINREIEEVDPINQFVQCSDDMVAIWTHYKSSYYNAKKMRRIDINKQTNQIFTMNYSDNIIPNQIIGFHVPMSTLSLLARCYYHRHHPSIVLINRNIHNALKCISNQINKKKIISVPRIYNKHIY